MCRETPLCKCHCIFCVLQMYITTLLFRELPYITQAKSLQSLSYGLDSELCPKEHKSARAEASSRSPAIQHLAVTDLISSQTPLFTSETTACGIFGSKTVDYSDLLAQRNVAISSERALPPAAAPAVSGQHRPPHTIFDFDSRAS